MHFNAERCIFSASCSVFSMNPALLQPWLQVALTVVQITFYLTTGTIAFLAFRKASQTLLQPRWTESYKEQMKVFSEINSFFNTLKESPNLVGGIGYNDVVAATLWIMFDRYAREKLHYDDYRNGKSRPYDEIRTSTVIPGVPFEVQTNPGDLQTWYKIAPKFESSILQLKRFRDHPLLPTEAVELIKQFLETVNQNLYAIFEASREIAEELARRYPDPQSYDRSQISWAQVKVHQRLQPLHIPAARLLDFIRTYTHADSIFGNKPRKKKVTKSRRAS